MTKEARLYGSSLYELASDEGLSDEMMQQTALLRDIFSENPDYISLLQEPAIDFKERVGLIDAAFGGKVHTYLTNFIKLLCERGYMHEFGDCMEAFQEHYYADHNITRAFVTSAVALSGAQEAALLERLERISGKQVVIVKKVDPQLLGGIRVEMDGKMMDGTLSSRMTGLKRSLRELTL